jgi:intracellular septation protein A
MKFAGEVCGCLLQEFVGLFITMKEKSNPLVNLLFNIILPILVLNKLSAIMGAVPALILALSAPFIYLVWDLWKMKKVNYFSVLGLLNVGLTGGLAVLNLDGFWFWIKEAAFPGLVGIFVLGSAWTRRPFIQTLMLNPEIMNLELIESRVQAKGESHLLERLAQKATILLSLSFFVSSILNFVVARRIFLPISSEIQGEARSLLLNEQIAEMTKVSFPIILVPSFILLMGLMFYLLHRLKKLTGLKLEEIIPHK